MFRPSSGRRLIERPAGTGARGIMVYEIEI